MSDTISAKEETGVTVLAGKQRINTAFAEKKTANATFAEKQYSDMGPADRTPWHRTRRKTRQFSAQKKTKTIAFC